MELLPHCSLIGAPIADSLWLDAEDQAKLIGCVTAIMERAEFDGHRFATEVRRAMLGCELDALQRPGCRWRATSNPT